MKRLALLVLVAASWSPSSASSSEATGQGDSVNVQSADVGLDGEDVDEQLPLDYSQQPINQQPVSYQQPMPVQQPAYGYYQQPVQQVQQQPDPRFLANAAYQQSQAALRDAQGFAAQQQQQQQMQIASPAQVASQPPAQVTSGQQGVPALAAQVPTGNQAPPAPPRTMKPADVQSVSQMPAQVTSAQQDTPDLTVTIKPADGSGDAAAGTASHLQHETKFSICDLMPPPWNIICYIFQFIFFTWPMYYFWLGLIALAILQQIYLAFKETLDPIIIAILDAIYLVVWCVVKTCQFIWMVIKMIAYPIKQAIFSCYDTVDQHLNPYKQRRPHTHVPGFSY